MTQEQLRALIMAVLSLDERRSWTQVAQLALEADEIIQHAREPFFQEPEPRAER